MWLRLSHPLGVATTGLVSSCVGEFPATKQTFVFPLGLTVLSCTKTTAQSERLHFDVATHGPFFTWKQSGGVLFPEGISVKCFARLLLPSGSEAV